MGWLRQSNNTNALQEQIQQLLERDPADSGCFSIDIDRESIRQLIGKAFVEEPGLKWAMDHFDRSKVLQTREELVHFSRFANSFALLEDLDAPLNFQLCQVETKDDVEIISCASLHACQPTKPRGPKWLRSLQSTCKMAMYTVRIMYGFGETLPSVVFSQYMSRLEAKMQPFVENVDEWHYEHGPSRPHWYLHLVGVDPSFNGQGKGKIIMKKICSLADELEQDIYLEACGEKLKGYYEKFGFRVTMVQTLVDPEDDASSINVHLMVRDASKQYTTSAAK